jgi:hypothetical protein
MSTPVEPMDSWLAAHPDVSRRIVLPAALKWEVRDKLDQAGITERVLFPGLDGLTAWLTRYYTPHAGYIEAARELKAIQPSQPNPLTDR